MYCLATSGEKTYSTTLISRIATTEFKKIYCVKRIQLSDKMRLREFKCRDVGWKMTNAGFARGGHIVCQ